METWAIVKDDNVLCHYGVKGMEWGKKKAASPQALAAAWKVRRRKLLEALAALQNHKDNRRIFRNHVYAENEKAKQQAVREQINKIHRNQRQKAAANAQAQNMQAQNEARRAKSAREQRRRRAAQAQADTIKAGQQQVKSMVQKARKKARWAKSSSAAAKTQQQHVERMINKYSKTKYAWSSADSSKSVTRYTMYVSDNPNNRDFYKRK